MTINASVKKHYKEANRMLKKKDLLGFVSNIGKTILLAKDQDHMIAEATYLEAKGLMKFKRHSKALESIEKALTQNSIKEKVLDLKKNKGLALGYLGEIGESINIFEELAQEEVEDNSLIVSACINIGWVYMTLDEDNLTRDRLDSVKKYLDIAKRHLDEVSDKRKARLLNAISVYYYFTKEYDKSIAKLQDAAKYSAEEDLPEIYTNLAELYLVSDEYGVAEVVKDYLKEAEIIASKNNNDLFMGNIFMAQATVHIREREDLKALDALYVAFDHFKSAEAYPLAFDCTVKINNLINEHKLDRLKSLNNEVKKTFKRTPYYQDIKEG